MTAKHRLLMLGVLAFFWGAQVCHAFDLAAGLGTAEEGDDRFHPSVLMHVGKNQYFSRFHYYGQSFGAVTKSIYLLSANRELDVFRMWGWDFLKGGFGIVLVDQHTALKFEDHPEDSKSEDLINIGFNVGVYAALPVPEEVPVFAKIGWESHVFLAGTAGILLANGRKQIISLCAGVSL